MCEVDAPEFGDRGMHGSQGRLASCTPDHQRHDENVCKHLVCGLVVFVKHERSLLSLFVWQMVISIWMICFGLVVHINEEQQCSEVHETFDMYASFISADVASVRTSRVK